MFLFHVKIRRVILLTILSLLLASGCAANEPTSIPADFYFMLDVRSAEPDTAQHINIQIHADGEGKYEYYETGGVIHYDMEDIVTYKPDQIAKRGKFELSNNELEQLWRSIQENGFFELNKDYQMALGHSYAFLLVQADDNTHFVDNIGMEVPEMRALVETAQTLLPDDVDVEYGEGFIP